MTVPDASTVETLVRPDAPGEAAPVVIGLPAYNARAFIGETLRSLLADQTYRHFRLVILDDASSDDTLTLILEQTAGDPRVYVYRHRANAGMIATWRDVFALARAAAPEAELFAWAADHDVLDKDWLSRLYAHARKTPQAAVIYPSVRTISTKGDMHPGKPPRYETREPDPIGRFDHCQTKGVGFGNIIYGLIRIDLLDRAGVFRRVLAPDRLTVLELSLMGELHEVPKALRLRRKTATYSIQRQKAALFGPAGPPPHSHLAFFLSHAALLLKHHLGDGGLIWKARLTGAVGHMLLDQSWRQTVGKWRKERERAAALAIKAAEKAAASPSSE